MGHDIYAYKVPEQELETYRERYELDQHDNEEWRRRYNQYCKVTQASYFRRSAFDPANMILYRVLGAEDLYAGCSGCGESRDFTREDIQQAYDALDTVMADVRPKLDERARIVKDMLDKAFANSPSIKGNDNITIVAGPNDDEEITLDWEREFLREIMDWMNESGKDRITIRFG